MTEWPALSLKALDDLLRQASASSGGVPRTSLACARAQFSPAVKLLLESGARLLTLSAMPGDDGDLLLTYTFAVGASSVLLRTPTLDNAIESLYSSFPAADFLEREVNNLFSVKFLGNPNLAQTVVRSDDDGS